MKKSAKKNNYAKSKLEQKIAPAQEKAPPTLVNTSQEQAISRKAPEKINSPASQENKKVVAPSASTKPKIAPAIAIRPDFKIFQIYFEPWQKDLLDGAFTPIDNAKFPSELREFDVFTRLANSEYVKGAKLWGALSWRFTEKTGMTSADLVKEINAFPDHDIYFCNPQPEYEALYHNLWLQGVPSHPQF